MLRLGLILVLLAGCGGPVAHVSSQQSAAIASTQNSSINSYRRAAGLRPLTQSARLDAIAARHANDMSRNGFFSHVGSNGSTVGQRARARGYDYCRISENIAKGQKSRDEVMRDWYARDSHRTNMLHDDIREYGMARAEGNVWVMVMGRSGCRG
ncbi:CAP domain-containing protein [Aestuariicoccus sp. MJ-SS9]|uniref:CAP domain-containing protein n=1 Tax=Aestuariicoccus sp. MJ-SS9 TaxID=3079855 RepID=UPI00290971CB|nr:CAP domain-containing protein [Aestuariicoccus sp. MJ-SS9]MDU8910259.1 CAP domain-containing protein [Aestuariicoccus sp. MJ-SS9]